MKTTRVIVALFSAMTVASIASAQTVDFVIVGKQHAYNQTDNTTVVDAANPWSFHAGVEGTSLSGSTPTISLPGGSGSTTFGYNAGDDAWSIDVNFASSGLLNAAYADGNYSITVLAQTVTPMNISGDTFPAAPIASLSGGTIVGGTLNWDASQALTITIGGSGIDHMGVFVYGSSYNNGAEGFAVSTQSFTVPAFAMTIGQTYTVELNFDDIVGGTAPVNFGGTGGMSATQFAGIYSAQTKFTIQAVPEPATCAALLGLAGLAGVLIQRRRQTC